MNTIIMKPYKNNLAPKYVAICDKLTSAKKRVRDTIVLASWIYLLDESPSGRRRLLQEVKQLIWTQLEHTVAKTTPKLPMEQDRIRWIHNLNQEMDGDGYIGIVPFKPCLPKDFQSHGMTKMNIIKIWTSTV